MAVLRMQVSKLLFILFVIGFIANDVNGDCSRPVFTNPFGIQIYPDQYNYTEYYKIEMNCTRGLENNGLPPDSFCQPDGSWDAYDPTAGLCLKAQCIVSEVVDSDINVTTTETGGPHQTTIDNNEEAYFSCATLGQLEGAETGTCYNGTFNYVGATPECSAYCSVYLEELGDGLYYDIADPPVINENSTLYYENGKVITYGCSDGYEGPNSHTSSDDVTSTCNDGSWDPPGIPTCMDIDECSDSPCLNNGNCTDLINGYQCQCADGFNGTNCGNNIDDCASHECENGATCVDDIASYECQCPDGFNGIYCENGMMTTMELPTSMETTTIADQSTIALTTTKASTTEGLPTSLPNSTPPSTPMTPTDSSTTSVVTPGLATVTSDATSLTPGLTTVNPDTTSLTPGLTTVTPDTTSITPGLTTVTPDTTSITPGVTTVTLDATSITPGLTTATPDATTATPDATSITPGLTTVATDSTTVTPAISTETATPTVPESTTKSDSTTSSNPTSLLPETTETVSVRSTSPADPTEPSPTESQETTAISTETATPTVPESTTKSDSITSSNPSSLLPETTETVSVRSTSPADPTEPSPTESQETTASRKTSPRTPERTEKPPSTPLPCIECRATQVCNAENNCECRPDYYEDEDDTENPCKEPESIDVTIKITEVNDSSAEYNVKLGNSSSREFKKLESDVCKPFEEIYKNDTEYKGCRVLEFSEGSIIVNYVLTFAENSAQSASTVNATVQEELQDPNGSFTGDYKFDDSSLVVAPLDECNKNIDDCDAENAICTDQGADGYTCECREGFDDVGIPKSLPGRECMKSDPRTTKEPEETGLEPWKVVVGVTVPIISILTITIVGLTCWQYRRLDKTSPKSVTTKMRTFPYEDDTRGSSDRRASRPESMMIMNNDGTVQEVVLPWRNIPAEEEFIFAPDNNGKGRTQMLPTVDYPSDYAGSASYDNDPLGNIVGSYDNYTYQHHDMTNSTEIDSKYF